MGVRRLIWVPLVFLMAAPASAAPIFTFSGLFDGRAEADNRNAGNTQLNSDGGSFVGIPSIVPSEFTTAAAGSASAFAEAGSAVDLLPFGADLTGFAESLADVNEADGVDADFDTANAHSQSAATLTLTLDQHYAYTLAGLLGLDIATGDGSVSVQFDGDTLAGAQAVNAAGTLTPGVHALILLATSSVLQSADVSVETFARAEWDLALTLTPIENPVPEPGSLALLALGGAAAWRRHRPRPKRLRLAPAPTTGSSGV